MVVSAELLKLTRGSLGESPKRILVTGGTGFVGSRVAQTLVEAGHQVTISGRSKYRAGSKGEFIAADLRSKEDVAKICQGQQIVIHSGALTSPWGTLGEHRAVNVEGTRNVIEACQPFSVERLVHVSSTAIFFQFRDRDRVTDQTEFPKSFCCPYAQSKAESETLVREAIDQGLNAYVVRARAVFGPGDSTLLPRFIKAAQSGRLRQIGSGENLCDLTYIDNLVGALILAACPNRPQGVCTITNESPVLIWDVLKRVLSETTDLPPLKKVPYWLALRFAHLAEIKHRILRIPGEPAITRYGVGLLTKQQTFESSAAKDELGYRPLVAIEAGINKTISSLKQRIGQPTPDQVSVDVKFFSTGYIEFKRHLAQRGASRTLTRFHATVALIKHPVHGLTLFDAGYSPRFFEATKYFPERLYRMATKVYTHPQWAIESWLQRDNIAPEQIDRVIISHFHGDHTCSLKAFPRADFLASKKAWDFTKSRSRFGSVKHAILPDLIPEDFGDRFHAIDSMNSPGIGKLNSCHDLFGDGSVRIFDLDGHADGQIGALLQRNNGRQSFLLADAFWTRREIQSQLKPTFAFRMVADNYKAALASREAIQDIASRHSEIEMICTHCPDFAEEQKFDQRLEEALAVFPPKL